MSRVHLWHVWFRGGDATWRFLVAASSEEGAKRLACDHFLSESGWPGTQTWSCITARKAHAPVHYLGRSLRRAALKKLKP